jgi:hypothetical protein
MAKVCRRSGKVNYRSEGEARAAIGRVAYSPSVRRHYEKHEADYYKCPHCPYFHLTSQRQRRAS